MIGEKLGKYTLIDVVGTGSMGTVYRAEDPVGRLVALKLVRSKILHTMEKRERFLQCLLIASGIRHKGVCPILEIGDDNDDFFVITPFIDGKTLEHYMEKKPLPWRRALEIALAVGTALEAIHSAGATHRGLKPANIWILNDCDQTVMLSDCSIARFTEIIGPGNIKASDLDVDFADMLIPLGSLAYMSPEQVRGESLDHRTDIFSLGVVLYEMLSARHPFETRNSLSCISAILEAEAPPLVSKHLAVPPQLESILRKTLAKDREHRYSNVRVLVEELESARQNPAAQIEHGETPSGIRNFIFSKFLRNLRK